MSTSHSFNAQRTLDVDGRSYEYFSLPAAAESGLSGIERLPYSLKVLLENALRHEDGDVVTRADIEAFADWAKNGHTNRDVAFHPVRILMPDSSGVPLLADLAAMRDAMQQLGGCDATTGRRRCTGQSAHHSGHGDRSFRRRRSCRHCRCIAAQRRSRIRAQRRALQLPALGARRV
jgi:hypothetical protein